MFVIRIIGRYLWLFIGRVEAIAVIIALVCCPISVFFLRQSPQIVKFSSNFFRIRTGHVLILILIALSLRVIILASVGIDKIIVRKTHVPAPSR